MAKFSINPGEMRTQITLQSPTVNVDGGGAQSLAYANVSPNPVVYARWINAHGNEPVTSEALKSVQRATVVIRHRTDIQATWQIVKDGEPWQIISLDFIRDQHRWIEIIAERVKATI